MQANSENASIHPLKSIEANGNNFYVRNYLVEGKPAEVLSTALKDGKVVEEVFEDILTIGAIAIQQSKSENVLRQIEVAINGFISNIDKEANQKFPQAIKQKSEEFVKTLEKFLDPATVTSIQSQMQKILESQYNQMSVTFKTEFAAIKTLFAENMQAIKNVKEVADKSTQKGIPFQRIVGQWLERFAGTEDNVSDVSKGASGDSARANKGNSGDFVVTVNQTFGTLEPIAFCVEAKASKQSESEALRELNENMKNRKVQMGIIVYPSIDFAPTNGQRFKVFPGNRIITILDESDTALHCAYILAKTLAVSYKNVRDEGSISLEEIQKLGGELSELLNIDNVMNKEAANIQNALTRLLESVKKFS